MIFKDWSISAITAGFVAVLVSYSGPLMIFFQAAQSAEVSNAMITSWVWAISIGAAVSGILLSLLLKVPVVTAWSAPGTALLVTLFPDLSLGEAVGGYLVAAAVIFVIGVTGSFDRIIRRIPPGIASTSSLITLMPPPRENTPVKAVAPTNTSKAGTIYSDDDGQTWHVCDEFIYLPMRGSMEPKIEELKDGRLLMVMRTQLGSVFQSFSEDGGAS